MIGGSTETVGENKEFTLLAIEDVTIYFNGGVAGTNTSVNDTATEKYFNTQGLVKVLVLRTNQTLHIKSMNGVTFTDPITVTVSTSYTEHFDTATLFKMVIRAGTVGTSVKLRVTQR